MKITFSVSSQRMPEEQVLRKLKEDWGYERAPRDSPDRNLTFVAPRREYYIAIITSPKEYEGKIAGYCGIGFYDDILTDSGAYTLGGKAMGKGTVVDLRENGVYTTLRNIRNDAVESMADAKGVPFLVLLGLKSNAHGYYRSRGYVENSKNVPEWCLNKMEGTGKSWFVYNENDEAMKKAWDIIKGD